MVMVIVDCLHFGKPMRLLAIELLLFVVIQEFKHLRLFIPPVWIYNTRLHVLYFDFIYDLFQLLALVLHQNHVDRRLELLDGLNDFEQIEVVSHFLNALLEYLLVFSFFPLPKEQTSGGKELVSEFEFQRHDTQLLRVIRRNFLEVKGSDHLANELSLVVSGAHPLEHQREDLDHSSEVRENLENSLNVPRVLEREI